MTVRCRRWRAGGWRRSLVSLGAALAVATAGCARSGYLDREMDACWPDCGGMVDASFGAEGVFVLDLGGIDNVAWGAQAIDVQADGRILVAGVGGSAADRDVLALRLSETGSLDASFGREGIALIDFGTADSEGQSLRVQPDGTFVVAGASGERTAVARLLADGGLDASFAGTGRRLLALTGGYELANGQASMADGSLRLCGQGRLTADAASVDVLVYGLLWSGELDAAFGDAGLAALDFGGDDFADCGFVDEAGRLVVAGSTLRTANHDFAVARIQADGDDDATFTDAAGLPGRAITDFFGEDDAIGGCAPHVRDTILCAGTAAGPQGMAFPAARYLATGQLDASFGTGGLLVIDTGGDAEARALVVLADGRFLIGGSIQSARGDHDLAVAGCDAAGALVPGFGTGGLWTHDVAAGQDDAIHALRLDPRGRLLLYGHTTSRRGDNDIVVMRLQP